MVALIAGHAYVFTTLFNHLAGLAHNQTVVGKDQWLPLLTWLIVATPLIGVTMAYLALYAEAGSRFARVAELSSLFLITLFAAGLLWMFAGDIGLITVPHKL